MSITITIPGLDRPAGTGRALRDLLPLAGSVLLVLAEEFIPRRGDCRWRDQAARAAG